MRLIDADKLIDYTDDRYSWHEIGRRDRDEIVWAIESAPTVEAEPVKHGRWKYDGNGMDWNIPAWICSECGFRNDMIPTLVKGVNGIVEFQNPMSWSGSKYCANCGARMDAE